MILKHPQNNWQTYENYVWEGVESNIYQMSLCPVPLEEE